MANANTTGILPAYRRLVMDMSITLGQVLNFEASKPDSFHVVNVRGQVNSAYAPAQVQDFMDWMLAVSPNWTIQTTAPEDGATELTIEDFDICKYQSVYSNAVFVKHLARLLHQGSITILMSVVPAPDSAYKLMVEIIHRHHVKVLSFVSGTTVEDIGSYVLSDDCLVTTGDAQEVHIEPYQVAAVTQRNNRTMGYPRTLTGLSVVCGALIGRNGTVESVAPLLQAMTWLNNVVTANLVEYGFKISAQLLLMKSLNDRILDAVVQYYAKEGFETETPHRITVDFGFLDDDRSHTVVTPWNQVTVKIIPVIAPQEVNADIDEGIEYAENDESTLSTEHADEPFGDEA